VTVDLGARPERRVRRDPALDGAPCDLADRADERDARRPEAGAAASDRGDAPSSARSDPKRVSSARRARSH